jgi:hypothetical protein
MTDITVEHGPIVVNWVACTLDTPEVKSYTIDLHSKYFEAGIITSWPNDTGSTKIDLYPVENSVRTNPNRNNFSTTIVFPHSSNEYTILTDGARDTCIVVFVKRQYLHDADEDLFFWENTAPEYACPYPECAMTNLTYDEYGESHLDPDHTRVEDLPDD